MRPLALRIKGFTSFRDEQTIDFTDLDLFALWGPTGSGKSSVLDAMTYALYGKVDRVEQASALVSQGQPRMSVSFDFSANGRSYRVTRSTPPTKVRLEKLEDGNWRSYGAGADKVMEVNRFLIGLIGLDYLAFTRSVLLPQGKFAEFLAGDATDRRKILTELLGLELFDKMAKRANEIRKDEAREADIKEDMVARTFAGVDAESIAAAREGLEAATKKGGRVAGVLVEVEGLGQELVEHKASTEVVVACRAEVVALAATFETHAAQLGDIAREEAAFRADLDRAGSTVAGAAESLDRATEERIGAEKRWGSMDALVVLTERARNLHEATDSAARADASLTEERARAKQGSLGIDSAIDALERAQSAEAAAAEKLARSNAAVEEAHRHDRVGSLVHGRSTGDPCPVCERPLETIPSFDASELEAALESRESAARSHKESLGSVNEATTALAVARKDHATTLEQIARCEGALAEARAKQSALSNELEIAFDKGLPEDPAGELGRRVQTLRQLVAAEGDARAAHEAACSELATFDERRRVQQEKTAEIRTRMDSDSMESVLDRVLAAAPDCVRPDLPTLDSLPTSADDLAGEAEQITKSLKTLGDDLDGTLGRKRAVTENLVASMRSAVPAEFDMRAEGPAIVGELRELEKTTAAQIAVAKREVAELDARLEQRRSLEDEIAHHREQQAAYSDLQKELKADRIVQHLQAEALVVLADAASHHLRDLSDSRYRLVYDEDRFYVVDAWNGDEQRNVKTLSGGETFLTSLALALALSEQIQLLSVTEKSRLESLFLDEGFGQLDADLLEVVVNAIEQMRSTDRLVGVVTHVADLAERMPTRLVVSKSPRGSTVTRSEAGAPL